MTATGLLRLDVALVAGGLAVSRSQAQAMVEAGLVRVDGQPVTRAAQKVRPDQALEAEAQHPWVSRGGQKLAHALDAFGIDPAGRTCLDIGSSTGGFTDVLLARGARRIVAVDVGRGQLHERLGGDPRVLSLEAQDARTLSLELIGDRPELIVADVSFIGLAKALPTPLSLAAPGADLVALFKPQFEVGPGQVGKGGIVSDPAATERARTALESDLARLGWTVRGWTHSPIRGGDGNAEFLLWARR